MALQWVLGIERFGKGETGEIMGVSPVVNGFNMFQPVAFHRSMTSVVTSASIQVINGHNPKSGKRMLNIESAWLI